MILLQCPGQGRDPYGTNIAESLAGLRDKMQRLSNHVSTRVWEVLSDDEEGAAPAAAAGAGGDAGERAA